MVFPSRGRARGRGRGVGEVAFAPRSSHDESRDYDQSDRGHLVRKYYQRQRPLFLLVTVY